ncbi:TOBE domain-containing protein [Calothrix sp. 336/3]|uniref:TOBE domain-containing protein n=1 Tax=Calothrix sp. 336/3 TaxID=1337936 RepID=UPI0004E41A55|nr:molybdopterin-binding protein [Calothrix sp. 336/3]AKG20989.1 transporter [Calothrix sp. 336/3]
MPRKEQGWITFQASEEERQLLEELSQLSQRTKTEILRELVRGLSDNADGGRSMERSPQTTQSKRRHKNHDTPPTTPTETPKKFLKVSSRNILKGVVTKVIRGEVNSQVTLKVVHEVELTSIITTTSAEELGIEEGTDAYAVIKSNDIVIAKD